MKLNLALTIVVGTVAVFGVTSAFAQQPVVKKTAAKKITAAKPAVKKVVTAPLPSAAKVYPNGIKLNVKGLTVEDAFLTFEDGTKVPEGNKIDLNQRISLRINLSKGFKEINGKVFPGGTEKITLSNGDKILESDDLFTAFDSTGVSPEDAKYITMKAVINEMKDKTNAVNIAIRVWDKKTDANEITGTYTIYIK